MTQLVIDVSLWQERVTIEFDRLRHSVIKTVVYTGRRNYLV